MNCFTSLHGLWCSSPRRNLLSVLMSDNSTLSKMDQYTLQSTDRWPQTHRLAGLAGVHGSGHHQADAVLARCPQNGGYLAWRHTTEFKLLIFRNLTLHTRGVKYHKKSFTMPGEGMSENIIFADMRPNFTSTIHVYS